MNDVCDAPLGKLLVARKAARSFAARYAGRTVLAIGAHPDDIELGIGATVAMLAHAGARVVMAVCSIPGDYDRRRAEALEAAAILGCELRILMDGGGRRIEDVKAYQLVGMIDDTVRDLRPAALLTHGSTDFHGDHVLVHHASVPAQRLHAFDFYCYLPTMVRPVPVPFQPRAYIDVTSTIERKIAAIAAHKSQFGSRGISFDYYREIAHLNGVMCGAEYAEGLDIGRIVFA
jgi:LmbE family N-acetylglucosaminyl deacetylase